MARRKSSACVQTVICSTPKMLALLCDTQKLPTSKVEASDNKLLKKTFFLNGTFLLVCFLQSTSKETSKHRRSFKKCGTLFIQDSLVAAEIIPVKNQLSLHFASGHFADDLHGWLTRNSLNVVCSVVCLQKFSYTHESRSRNRLSIAVGCCSPAIFSEFPELISYLSVKHLPFIHE
jgi:hypothetical protein